MKRWLQKFIYTMILKQNSIVMGADDLLFFFLHMGEITMIVKYSMDDEQ